MSRYRHAPTARARRLAALVPLLGTVALATACTATEDPPAAAPTSTAPTSAPASTTPTGPASPSDSAPATIPTSAFVELPTELRKSPRRATSVGDALPKLCANEFGTGDRQVTASAAMTVTYKLADEPSSNVPQGMIHQTIFSFDGDGASAYLTRLRTAIEACPTYERSGPVTVQSKTLTGVGDEALLLTRTWPETALSGERTGRLASSQIAVARVDDAVTVLDDQGWEGTSGNPTILDRTLRDGVRAIDTWQR
ncbi:hypothetical protein O7634_19110 [Micromonospora sp. WMMD1120]|uniref:hypothetical protein n=1 Tax=Micromonospora sp. WMMD1120 TaxID=3016106 RepID=UPI002416953E|nr:hypothetical protein [Micromonospora sp. WMMD1120]MDG4808860.1 hypothetical protein [Micromonospora sp. WMMD1120]